MTGVKNQAKSMVGCKNFKMSDNFNEFLDIRAEDHDKIKDDLLKHLSRNGFNCQEEYPVSGNNLRGKIDIFCQGQGEKLLIEVKSYPISNGNILDGLQLLFYKFLIGNDEHVHAVLVYKNPFPSDGNFTFNIGEMSLTLPRKYSYINLKDSIDILKDMISSSAEKIYVITKDCIHCVNSECPLQRAAMKSTNYT